MLLPRRIRVYNWRRARPPTSLSLAYRCLRQPWPISKLSLKGRKKREAGRGSWMMRIKPQWQLSKTYSIRVIIWDRVSTVISIKLFILAPFNWARLRKKTFAPPLHSSMIPNLHHIFFLGSSALSNPERKEIVLAPLIYCPGAKGRSLLFLTALKVNGLPLISRERLLLSINLLSSSQRKLPLLIISGACSERGRRKSRSSHRWTSDSTRWKRNLKGSY